MNLFLNRYNLNDLHINVWWKHKLYKAKAVGCLFMTFLWWCENSMLWLKRLNK